MSDISTTDLIADIQERLDIRKANGTDWNTCEELTELLLGRLRADRQPKGAEPVAWLDMRSEPAGAEDWKHRLVATNPDFVAKNGPENFRPLFLAHPSPAGGLREALEKLDIAATAYDVIEAINYLHDQLERGDDAEIHESHWLDPMMHTHGVLLDIIAALSSPAPAGDWNAAIEAAAKLLDGIAVHEHYRTWPAWNPGGNVADDNVIARFAKTMAEAIRALARPAQPEEKK